MILNLVKMGEHVYQTVITTRVCACLSLLVTSASRVSDNNRQLTFIICQFCGPSKRLIPILREL